MGYGSYSYEAHRAITGARTVQPVQQVFAQRACHPLMNPHGVRARESRDSAEHPQSLGIVFALDVTGSMGTIPELLAREALPGFMKLLSEIAVPDPQVLFMTVGDAVGDRAPLQVGQFESTAELMIRFHKHWLGVDGRTKKTKDEALRSAQLEFIHGDNEDGEVVFTGVDGKEVQRDFSSPYYWAAFQVIGDYK